VATTPELTKEITALAADLEGRRQQINAKRQIYAALQHAIHQQTEAEERIRDLQRPVPDKTDNKPAYERYLKELQRRNDAWENAQRNVIRTADRWAQARRCIDAISQRLGVLARRLPIAAPWPKCSRVLKELARGITNPLEWFDPEPGGCLDVLKLRLSEMRDMPSLHPIQKTQATANKPETVSPSQVTKHWQKVWAPRLRNARLKRDHTQKEAAAACGVPLETYRKWEPGKIRKARTPAKRNVPKILNYIDSEERPYR
jgi:DNA-binding XRE family transcriptional regulator